MAILPTIRIPEVDCWRTVLARPCRSASSSTMLAISSPELLPACPTNTWAISWETSLLNVQHLIPLETDCPLSRQWVILTCLYPLLLAPMRRITVGYSVINLRRGTPRVTTPGAGPNWSHNLQRTEHVLSQDHLHLSALSCSQSHRHSTHRKCFPQCLMWGSG